MIFCFPPRFYVFVFVTARVLSYSGHLLSYYHPQHFHRHCHLQTHYRFHFLYRFPKTRLCCFYPIDPSSVTRQLLYPLLRVSAVPPRICLQLITQFVITISTTFSMTKKIESLIKNILKNRPWILWRMHNPRDFFYRSEVLDNPWYWIWQGPIKAYKFYRLKFNFYFILFKLREKLFLQI